MEMGKIGSQDRSFLPLKRVLVSDNETQLLLHFLVETQRKTVDGPLLMEEVEY